MGQIAGIIVVCLLYMLVAAVYPVRRYPRRYPRGRSRIRPGYVAGNLR